MPRWTFSPASFSLRDTASLSRANQVWEITVHDDVETVETQRMKHDAVDA